MITYRLMHELIRSKTFVSLGRGCVHSSQVSSFDRQLDIMDKLIKEAKESLKRGGYKV